MRLLRALAAGALLLAAGAFAWAQPGPGDLAQRLARAELLAGLTAVTGPGIAVTLRHSPRVVPRGADPRGFRLHDQDVNGILNALRAGGAEALALAGRDGPPQRVLANTAAVESRDAFLVNGMPLLPPLRVLAIGDAGALRAALLRPAGVVKRAGLDTLQMVQLEDVSRLELPAAAAPRPFRFARPLGASAALPAAAAPPPPVSTAPTSAPAPPVPAAVGAGLTVFGGRGLDRFHREGCRFGERIPADQRVFFRSPAEARGAGRVPCSVCAAPGAP